MAATSTAFAATSVSAAVAVAARGDASSLSSGSAFRTSSIVQFAPLRSKRSNRIVVARAALSEDSKTIQRDVIVSILAAGAALGFSVSAVDGAFANPIEAARNKATTSLNSAKNSAPSLPSAPNPGGAVEDAKKGAENVATDLTGQIDGVFGKGKLGPVSKGNVGSTGGAIGDAKKRISSSLKNPIAENIEQGSEKTATNIASATPKPNAQRVDEATKKVENIGSDLQNKGQEAISEGKGFFGDKAQGSIPKLPEVFPKLETPSLPTPNTGKLEELKGGVQSKAGEAKRAVESALQ